MRKLALHLLGLDLARAKHDPSSAVSDGLGGVGDEIHHDLRELGGIRLHRRKILRQVVDEFGLPGDRPLEQLRHLLHELRNIERLDRRRSFAPSRRASGW